MTTPAPATDDHRGQLRQLLAQGADYAAALDDIAHDDPRRLADVANQVTAWHSQIGAALDHLSATRQDKPVSATTRAALEYAARQFETAPQPEDTSTQ